MTRADQRKSVGTQISWGVRFDTNEQVKRFLVDLAAEVAKRLKQVPAMGARVTLMVSAPTSQLFLANISDTDEQCYLQVKERDRSSETSGSRQAAERETPAGKGKARVKYMNPGAVKVVTRSQRLLQATDDGEVLARTAASLFLSTRVLPTDVRGFGLHVDNLEKPKQGKSKKKGSIKGQMTLTSFFSKKTPAASSSASAHQE